MPTVPAGSVSITKATLADQLADCATFRTLCGASTRAGALGHVHFDRLLPLPAEGDDYTQAELVAARPFAIISLEDRLPVADGSRSDGSLSLTYTYTHNIRIERNVPGAIATDEREIDLTWDNVFGSIMDELEELAGQGGYLACTVRKIEGPARTHPDDVPALGDAQAVTLQATSVG